MQLYRMMKQAGEEQISKRQKALEGLIGANKDSMAGKIKKKAKLYKAKSKLAKKPMEKSEMADEEVSKQRWLVPNPKATGENPPREVMERATEGAAKAMLERKRIQELLKERKAIKGL